MRIVVLTCEHSNQIALCNKLAGAAELAAVVCSRNIARKRPKHSTRILLNRVQYRLLGRPLVRSWFAVMERYRSLYPELPPCEVLRVDNINDGATIDVIERHDPDLVVVSGTNLVGRKVITSSTKRLGIINLHTGISPYVKGGPNCTNWCLAEGTFHLIGSTVMWLDPGIDTGMIVATERTPLNGSETLFSLHWKVMEHAHDLYLRSIQALAAGHPVPRVLQSDLGEGRTFYTADWGGSAMLRALINYKRFYSQTLFSSPEFREKVDRIRLIPVEDGPPSGL
jgi:methionyl-tRNA formyltransferase